MAPGTYFRFNPPGLEHIELNDWKAVPKIIEVSRAYLVQPDVQAKLAIVARRLCEGRV